MKPLIRTLAFVLLLSAVLLGFNERYKHSDKYRSLNGLLRFESIPEELDVVNTGTSHARFGISYAGHPELRGYNLAMDGQKLSNDKLILEAYASHLREKALVIIEISYLSFYLESGLPGTTSPLAYYRILPRSYIPDYSLQMDLQYHIFPVLTAQKFVMWVFEPTGHPNDNLFMDAYVLPTDEKTLAGERQRWADHMFSFYQGSTPEMIQKAVDSLLAMLSLCEENQWQPVLISTPFLSGYESSIPEEMRADYFVQLQKILDKFPAVQYLNYMKDIRFTRDRSLFNEGTHLNEKGRTLFTDTLLNDCRELGLLPANQ